MMIDLRSDTLTRPSPGMRQAMAQADVGDDVYGEDPTITELERRTAELLGHEAGLFCPTGSMTNMLGIWSLVQPGDELLCDQLAHIARAEMGGHAALHGVTMRTWKPTSGTAGVAQLADITDLISVGTRPFQVETAAVALENTHNFAGGTVQPIELLREVHDACHERGVALHLDGARLWNAHIATGVPLAEYGRLFDTVSVCFSKGMGAPVGSVLVSSAERISRARIQRKRLGGGMRQAGVLAAAALYALDHNLTRLAEDHANARALAEQVAARAPELADPDQVATNIVIIDTGRHRAREVQAAVAADGVAISAVGTHLARAVTHLDVGREDCVRAGAVLGAVLAELRG